MSRKDALLMRAQNKSFEPVRTELEDESIEPLTKSLLESRVSDFFENQNIPLWKRNSLNTVRAQKREWNAENIVDSLKELEAENVVCIDIKGKCDWADFFIIAEAGHEKQRLAIMEQLLDSVRNT